MEAVRQGNAGRPARFFHGTTHPYEAPSPERFDDDEAYGPGYYLTSSPLIASTYASPALKRYYEGLNSRIVQLKKDGWEDPRDLELGIERLKRETPFPRPEDDLGSPNVRFVHVPEDLVLFDVEAPASAALIRQIEKRLSGIGAKSFAEWKHRGLKTNDQVYTALIQATRRKGEANELLASLGFDGIRYPGGQRIGLKDEEGQPIPHEALAIFASSLHRLRQGV
jgi:hypothetical protein